MDIGSTTTKGVLLEDKKWLASSLKKTGNNPLQKANQVLEEVLRESSKSKEKIDVLVATGYGRKSFPPASKTFTEITCHSRAAAEIFPRARLIIDIGGQDTKVIYLDEKGLPFDFIMNDKCAAGTGRFLEVMAERLEISLSDFAELALKSKKAATISSTCTVFAEAEIISLLASNAKVEEIAAGLCQAIAKRVGAMAGRFIPNRGEIIISGGVAYNKGVKRALEKIFKKEILLPPFPPGPQLMGAFGAALLGLES